MAWISGPNLLDEPPVEPTGVRDYGPFEYAGDLYAVARATGVEVYAKPSPLGLPDWTRFTHGIAIPLCSCIDATNPAIIHIITNVGGAFQIVDFNMGSGIFADVSTSPAITRSSSSGMDVISTPDGSLVIAYSGGLTARFVRYKAGTWSPFVTLHTFTSLGGPVGIERRGNDVYLAYGNEASAGFCYVRIVSPDDSLSPEFTAFSGNTIFNILGAGVTAGTFSGPVMKIYGDEIFLNLSSFGTIGTRRGGPVASPTTWVTDLFSPSTLEGPGQNYITLNGKLFAVWNHQQTDGSGGVIVDAMYGAQYQGAGVWCPRNLGIDFLVNTPVEPAFPYPDNGSHIWSAHGLANGTVGFMVDFFVDEGGGGVACTMYYANFSVEGCAAAGGVYPQRRRPRWIGNRG